MCTDSRCRDSQAWAFVVDGRGVGVELAEVPIPAVMGLNTMLLLRQCLIYTHFVGRAVKSEGKTGRTTRWPEKKVA